MKGLVISDEQHAGYVHDVEGCANFEGYPLKYFDTEEERNNYEKTLNNKK